jgi:hypothetical protein
MRLSGLDSAFLSLENATQFGHVSGLSIFTRPDTRIMTRTPRGRSSSRSGCTHLSPFAGGSPRSICDPDLLPDVDAMLDAILADLAALARSAGFTPAGGADSVTKRKRQQV